MAAGGTSHLANLASKRGFKTVELNARVSIETRRENTERDSRSEEIWGRHEMKLSIAGNFLDVADRLELACLR